MATADRDQALAVDDRPPDSTAVLRLLRAAYPRWGFLHDPGRGLWTAVRGDEKNGITLRKPDPVALRVAVDATGWHR